MIEIDVDNLLASFRSWITRKSSISMTSWSLLVRKEKPSRPSSISKCVFGGRLIIRRVDFSILKNPGSSLEVEFALNPR